MPIMSQGDGLHCVVTHGGVKRMTKLNKYNRRTLCAQKGFRLCVFLLFVAVPLCAFAQNSRINSPSAKVVISN
ncbi:MAG: hypothetical protein ACRCUY_13945, partial [Thermoguttaceae bacterium]